MAESRPDRLEVLDAFRGIAVLGVVMVHFFPRWIPGPGAQNLYGYQSTFPQLFAWGAYGVHLFFITSGFVIFMTLERCTHLVEFWFKRFARLYPAYVVAMLLTAVVVNTAGPPPLHATAFDVLVGLTFLTPFVSGARFVDSVYWTLVVELQFYLLACVAYRASARRFAPIWSLFVIATTAAWVAGQRLDLPLLRVLASRVLIAPYLPLFTVGIAFYLLHRGRYRQAAPLMVAATAAHVVGNMPAPGHFHVAHLVLAGLFAAFVTGRLQWLATRPLVFLGGISYSLYLTHFAIGLTAIGYLTTRLQLPDASAAVVAAMGCVGLASLLQRWVEVPARKAFLERASMVTRLVALTPGFRLRAPLAGGF